MKNPTKIPDAWSVVDLGEIADFINGDRGKNYPSQKDFAANGIPFINAGHIQDGNISSDSMNFIGRDRFDLLSSGKVNLNDILYCLRGSLGKCAIVRDIEEGAVASSLVIIRPSKEITTNYLYRYLISPIGQAQIKRFDNGSTQPNLSAKSVKEFEIPLPPLDEQRRIAAILDKADAVRRKRKEAIALTEDLLRSAFLEMFGDPVTNPKGWDIVSLEKTFGQNPQIGATKPAHPDGEQLIVRVGEIGGRNIRLENCGRITLESKDLEKNLCKPGDFLLARAIGSESHLGKASILQTAKSVVVFDSHVMRLRFSEDRLLPEVFLIWLKTKGGRVRFMREAGRTAVQFNVNAKQISRVKIPLPPITLQREFVDIYKRLCLNLDKYEHSRQITEDLFNSLLQSAFRGGL